MASPVWKFSAIVALVLNSLHVLADIRMRNGRFNSFENPFSGTKGIGFSSTTVTAFIRESWTHL